MDEKIRKILIDPDNLDAYLSHFNLDKPEDHANKSFWAGKKIFITGINGFVGSHLAEKLSEYGAEVMGLVRSRSAPYFPNISHLEGKIKVVGGNLLDFSSLVSFFRNHDPEFVFHLAAQSFVPTSFNYPIETYETNVVGTANLFEAIRKSESNVKKIHMAGTSEEYGKVDMENIPINENVPLRPQSPYAVSKVAAEMVSLNYRLSYGLPIVITRAFNHTGPRRGLHFVSSVISRQVARCLSEGTSEIVMGNTSPIRDFSDVRDMTQGYLLSIEKGKAGEVYNLGHGFGITIENLVRLTSGMFDLKPKIIIDKKKFRPTEVDVLICDFSKAKKELGYYPRFPMTKAMKYNVEYFLNNTSLMKTEPPFQNLNI